jgi:hypothetical protein
MSSNFTSPASGCVAVTASDSTDNATGSSGLLVGTAGAATLIMENGATATAVPLQAGYNPLRVRRVLSTGLTAANIWALYN